MLHIPYFYADDRLIFYIPHLTLHVAFVYSEFFWSFNSPKLETWIFNYPQNTLSSKYIYIFHFCKHIVQWIVFPPRKLFMTLCSIFIVFFFTHMHLWIEMIKVTQVEKGWTDIKQANRKKKNFN